jgi:hypothetical protein
MLHKLILSILSIILISGCATKIDRGSFREGFRSNNDKPHGYLVIADPTGSAPTPYIEKFEVRHGDCGGSRDWDDCTTDRGRSEIHTGSDNYEGDEYWYGWSLYLPSDFPHINPVYTALGQFHQEEGPATFLFEKSWRGLIIDRQRDGRAQQEVELLTDQELLGKWNKFEIHAKWSRKDDGYFDIYVNGELKYSWKGKTMYRTVVYQKYGVYRSFLSRYCLANEKNCSVSKEVPTQIAYYANVKRAKTREGLAPKLVTAQGN